MNVIIFGLLAIALYVAVAVRTSGHLATEGAGIPLTSLTGALALLAVCAHGLSLYPMAVTADGLNLGIYTAASLVAWLVAVFAIITTSRLPAASLAVVILPLAAVVIALSLIFTNQHLISESPGIALHIALSLVAYSLFAIASLQAVYLSVANRRLKRHQPVFGLLPPLPVMESLLFQLTSIAFVLLSLGLLIGAAYIEDIRAQHLAHKIVFSGLAWATFAVLVVGRYWQGWRGRRAVKYVLAGFVLLAVGFFGSKIALEVILQRA